MPRSRKIKARPVAAPPPHVGDARTRTRLVLGGLARWLLSFAERLASDRDEVDRVDRVRSYLDDLIVGAVAEPPLDDIALVVGLIGAAIELPPDEPDEPPPVPPIVGVGPRRHYHTLATAPGFVRTRLPMAPRCGLVGAW